MLAGADQHGLTQRDGFEVVASANLRLTPFFEGAQELGHGADEGIREPDLRPARSDPGLRLLVRAVAECAGRAGRIPGPADCAAGQPLRSLDTPMNSKVAGTPLAG